MFIAVAGPMQSGKRENQATLKLRGFEVWDVNRLLMLARTRNQTIISRYHSLGIADTLTATGERKGSYYLHLLRDPSIHQAVMEVELPAMQRSLLAGQKLPHGPKVAISWGYVHLMPEVLQTTSHVLLLEANRQVWFERLRRWASALGAAGSTGLSDNQLQRLVNAAGFKPGSIEQALRTAGVSPITVNTSPTDWGAHNLDTILRALR